MNKCKLCNQESELQQSHIIPRFIYKYMHKVTDNRITQFDGELNLWQRTNRQLKDRLFCKECEQLLGNNEKQFSDIFKKINTASNRNEFLYVLMNDCLLKEFEDKNINKKTVEEIQSLNYLHNKTHILEYFSISYIYRELLRVDYEINQKIVNQLNGFLLNRNNLSFMLQIRLNNSSLSFDTVTTPVLKEDNGGIIYFTFYLPNMLFLVEVHPDGMPENLNQTAIFTSNFFDDEIKTIEFLRKSQEGSRKSNNLTQD